jgi:hypothetical protein
MEARTPANDITLANLKKFINFGLFKVGANRFSTTLSRSTTFSSRSTKSGKMQSERNNTSWQFPSLQPFTKKPV